MSDDVAGPVILWVNNGCEGWSPKSYATLKEALEDQRYVYEFVVTKPVNYEVVERGVSKSDGSHTQPGHPQVATADQ